MNLRKSLLLLLIISAIPTTAYADAWTLVPTWLDLVEETQQCDAIPTEIVLSIIHIESNGVSTAITEARNDVWSVGLMQILAFDWRADRTWLAVPENNIIIGCEILAFVLEEENNDMRRALARYNCGLVGLEKNGCGLSYADEILNNLAPQYAVIINSIHNIERIELLIEKKRYPTLDN